MNDMNEPMAEATPSASSVSDAVTAPETTQESAAKAAPSKDAQGMSAVEMSSADEPETTTVDSTQPGALQSKR